MVEKVKNVGQMICFLEALSEFCTEEKFGNLSGFYLRIAFKFLISEHFAAENMKDLLFRFLPLECDDATIKTCADYFGLVAGTAG